MGSWRRKNQLALISLRSSRAGIVSTAAKSGPSLLFSSCTVAAISVVRLLFCVLVTVVWGFNVQLWGFSAQFSI
ncbi:hypothetical protein BJY52DRAFT_1316501 [Lactarius psammicola]|nr:hypothetical protein BJY52DRAFT_1316501 [Lactarius psammicola]